MIKQVLSCDRKNMTALEGRYAGKVLLWDKTGQAAHWVGQDLVNMEEKWRKSRKIP